MRARRARAVRPDVHDRGVTGDRRFGDGEPPLRLARGVRPCRRRRAGDGVPHHRRARPAAADRRARPRTRAPHDVRRPSAGRLPGVGGAGGGRHQLSPRGHRPGRRAAPRVLGQLRRPAHAGRRVQRHPAVAVRGTCGRLGHPAGERPARPRVPVLRAPSSARRDGAGGGDDRHDEQLRRAPRGRR